MQGLTLTVAMAADMYIKKINRYSKFVTGVMGVSQFEVYKHGLFKIGAVTVMLQNHRVNLALFIS